MPFLTHVFGWEGFCSTKIDYRNKVGTLILTSVEDLRCPKIGGLWILWSKLGHPNPLANTLPHLMASWVEEPRLLLLMVLRHPEIYPRVNATMVETVTFVGIYRGKLNHARVS